jgi:hypothetical protein
MRCVISERYKLIQNYRPEVPYYPSLDLVNSPSYGQIEKLKQAGELEGELTWYDHSSRPQVEFYDLEEDPGEWNNLADQSDQEDRIEKYQRELGKWMHETHDFLPPPTTAFPDKALNQNIQPLNGKPYNNN